MKIAFFLNRFPMLSQTFVLNQITGLIDRGHEVDIYAIRPENDTKMHADVTKYNLLNRTHYFRDIPSNKLLRGVTVVSLLIKNYYRKPTSLLKFLRFSRYGKISVVKIFVHRMGIDTSKFLCSPRNHKENGKVRLLTICRLV